MIDTTKLSTATCQVSGSKDGTGFFVGNGLILTCSHLVEGFAIGDTVKVFKGSDTTFNCVLKAVSTETDLAIVHTNDPHPNPVTLLNCSVPVGLRYAGYGHPDTSDGVKVGEPIHGLVIRKIEDSGDTIHDVSISTEYTKTNPDFQGFSGSGLVNAQGDVFAILRFSNANYVSAVSINKAANFLLSEGISLKEGELDDFKTFIEDAFGALDEGVREWCKATGKQISQVITPQLILETLQGALFYPANDDKTNDIILALMNNMPVNRALWLGWLRFLTFISLLEKDYEDFNKITISLGSVEFSKLMNVEITPIQMELTVTLKLLFTEKGNFITITSEYLTEKLIEKKLEHNSCHIFESSNSMFGHRPFPPENRDRIILNIAGGASSGVQVPGKLNFGVISMQQLSNEIGKSQNIQEATENLQNLFTNVFK